MVMKNTDRKQEFITDVARQLSSKRKKLGISQKEIAEKLGTKTPNISRLESGKQNFSLDSLFSYAEVLDYTPVFVMEDTKAFMGGINEYELKIFDEVLIRFTLERTYEGIEKINISYINENKKNLMPIGLELSPMGIKAWIKSRTVSKNRAYVSEILKSAKLDGSITGLIEVSKSLSLNDSYWIDKIESKLLFKDVNLYENSFDELLSLVAFVGMTQEIKNLKSSPELTTCGMLRKGWRRIESNIWLYKGGSETDDLAGYEPFCEYYASQIAEHMGLNHVEYDLKMWKGVLSSCCKLFTSKEISYVPIGSFSFVNEIEDVFDFYKKLGEEYYEALCDMLVFDAIIYNKDRHFGNFGLLRDNESGDFISTAPIFDNGQSLFPNASSYDISNLKSYRNKCHNPYERDWDYILKKALGKKQKEKLKKLKGFKLKEHPLYNPPSARLYAINEFLEFRIKEILGEM